MPCSGKSAIRISRLPPASTLLRIANSLLQGKQQGIFPVEENSESETSMNTGEFEMGRESAGK
ncbi:MAG: hypothetical protein DMG60_15160 [Acidobacteria bacterium]|nr:MAG: hypothetical protein DMG60_15160 [Acidobacteriota bacterium]